MANLPTAELCPHCWSRLRPNNHQQHQGWEWIHCGHCVTDFTEGEVVSRAFAQAIDQLVTAAADRYPPTRSASRAALRAHILRRHLMTQRAEVQRAAEQIAATEALRPPPKVKTTQATRPTRLRKVSTRNVPLCNKCWRWLTGPNRYNTCGGWKWYHCDACGHDSFNARWVPAHRARDLDDKVVEIRRRRDPQFDPTQLGTRPATRIRRGLMRTGWLECAA